MKGFAASLCAIGVVLFGALSQETAALANSPQLASKAVCPAPTPGHVSCMSEILQSGGRAVHPTVGGRIAPSDIAPDVSGGYSPANIQSAYALPANSPGKTIGIVDAFDNPFAESDLANYRAQWGLTPCTTANGCFRKLDENGGTNYPGVSSNWVDEIVLDVEAVSAACPNCHIVLVEAKSTSDSDMFTAVNEAITAGATIVSLSWGGSEFGGETSDDSSLNHSGIAIMAASGDDGYIAPGTIYPAASPYVTSVGGTSLTTAANSRGWNETVWNSGTNCNDPSPICATGSGCSTVEPIPTWQTGVTDASCSNRMVNDVSADADPSTGLAVYDTFQGGWSEFGGTSLSTPLIAGIYALAGGEKPGTTGAHGFYSDWALNDVTSGNNGSCTHAYFCTGETGYDGPTGLGTPKSIPVSASPASLTFAAQPFLTYVSAPLPETVTNHQTTAATTVTVGSITGPYASSFQATPAGGCASVAAQGICTISVAFTPAHPGAETATMTINDTSSSGSFVLQLTGTTPVPNFSGNGNADLTAVDSGGAWTMTTTPPHFDTPASWSSSAFYGNRTTLAGDVDGDGHTDLVAVNNGNVWIEFSNGSQFGAPSLGYGSPFFGDRNTLLADVNGDGKADLVAINSSSVWVLLSNGTTFGSPQQWSSSAFFGNRSTIAADVNGDGFADLVAVNNNSTWIEESSGSYPSGFGPPTLWSPNAFYGNVATIAGDVTGDGAADLIAVNNNNIFVMQSLGNQFGPSTLWSSGAFYGGVATLAGDFNGDGKLDLIAVNSGSSFVMTSTGTQFAPASAWSTNAFTGNIALLPSS